MCWAESPKEAVPAVSNQVGPTSTHGGVPLEATTEHLTLHPVNHTLRDRRRKSPTPTPTQRKRKFDGPERPCEELTWITGPTECSSQTEWPRHQPRRNSRSKRRERYLRAGKTACRSCTAQGVQNCRKRYQVVVHQAKVVLIIPSRKEKETNSARRKRFDSGRSSTQAQRHTLKQDNGAVTTLSTQCPMKRIRRNKVTRARAARRPQRDLNYEPAGTTGAWGSSKQLP